MEFLPGIHLLPGISWSRAYLIEDDSLALVDSGLPWNVGGVLNYIRSIGRKPEELGWILMTHSHPDHSGGAREIMRRTGAMIVAHPGDTKTHSNREVYLSYMGAFTSLRLPVPFLQRAHVGKLVSDGELLPILGGIRVFHTPGHTPGSVCYLIEDRKLLLSGDTLFSNGKRLSRSVPFPGYNRQSYRESLRRLASLEFDTLCGGHGVPLLGDASGVLRHLLATKPEPPSWGDFLRSMPRRLSHAGSLTGEDY